MTTIPEREVSAYDRENIGALVAGDGDWFSAHLFRLIAKADPMRLTLLAFSFPQHVAAFREWHESDQVAPSTARLGDPWAALDAANARVLRLEQMLGIQRCRVCACTDDDCTRCVERTGQSCEWVEPDLCSACAPTEGGA